MDTDSGKFETLVDEVDGRRLQFCSNVTEMPDGTIYFTESTSAFTYAHYMGRCFEARAPRQPVPSRSRRHRADRRPGAVLRQRRHADGGRVGAGDRRDAGTSAVEVLADRTAGRDCHTRWRSTCPAMPDNLSTGADGRIWCAMVTPANADGGPVGARAPPLLRKLLWRLPDRMQPQTESGGVGRRVRSRQRARRWRACARRTRPSALVTGMVEADDRLWMASIGAPAVAHCPLPDRRVARLLYANRE